VWEEALSLYERVNDVNALARLRRALALAEYDRGNVDAARTHLAAGVKALEGHPPSAELVDLQLARAVIHLRVLDLDEARKAAAELADLAESLHSPRVASVAYLAQARVKDVCGPLVGVRESCLLALAAAETSGDALLAQAIHDHLAVNAFSLGQSSLAREHAVRSLEIARRLGAPVLEAIALGRRAWCEFLAGSWDQSLGFTADALAIARRVSHPRALGMALISRTLVLAGRGDLDEARMCLAEIRATLGKGLSGYYASLMQAIEVLVALERGDAERTPIPTGDPNTFPVLRAGLPYGLAVLGEALVARGELTPAFGIVRDLDSIAAEGVPYFTALARHLEGLAHKALGANAEARVHLGQAADLFGALEIPYEHGRARLAWASVSHGSDEAVAAARGSLATFERLGARLYADRARRVLRQLGVRVEPARRPGPGGGPLSKRELEVARLVAEGLTTAEVAERLIISPLTASTHLHRMYERLGIGSRAALTRFLAESGLL
jgi:DNA-binding CsgD family transcriptional regulator/tetratricopeptide (TPR) repeat protein